MTTRSPRRPRKRSHTSRDCAAGCRLTACGASDMMALQHGLRLIKESFRLTMRDEPGIKVARAPGIDLFEDVQRGILLVKFHADLRIERGEAAGHSATGFLWKNNTNAPDCPTTT